MVPALPTIRLQTPEKEPPRSLRGYKMIVVVLGHSVLRDDL